MNLNLSSIFRFTILTLHYYSLETPLTILDPMFNFLSNFKVVNVENTEKGFGFIRIENDRGFHALNKLVTNVSNYPFKGRCLKVELR